MFSPSRPECFTWLSLLITESIIIVTFNVVTIIIFMRNRSLRTRGMYLVINLAVADTMSRAFSECMVFVYLGGRCDFWKYNLTGNWKELSVAMQLLFPVSSIADIVAISLQQLHAIFRPFQHRVIKKWVYGVAIAIVWIAAALISTLQHLKINHLTLWISFTSICLFTICVSYTLTALKFFRGRNIQHHGSSIRDRKLTVTLVIVTLVSLLLWLPYVMCSFLLITSANFRSLPDPLLFRLNFSLMVLYYANSLVNPIMYAIRMPEFKRALISLLRCQGNQVAVAVLSAPGNKMTFARSRSRRSQKCKESKVTVVNQSTVVT